MNPVVIAIIVAALILVVAMAVELGADRDGDGDGGGDPGDFTQGVPGDRFRGSVCSLTSEPQPQRHPSQRNTEEES